MQLPTDHRAPLLHALQEYRAFWRPNRLGFDLCTTPEEEAAFTQLFRFVAETPTCFDRTHLPGHITGSAVVASPELDRIVLTHHRRLGKWLQLGGHSDGHHLTWEVAMREAEEESGLGRLEFADLKRLLQPSDPNTGFAIGNDQIPLIFDIDCHTIPARPNEPEHIHYDVRFLILAPGNQTPVVSEESHDVAWFTIAQANEITREISMRRQLTKLQLLQARSR